MQVHTSGHATLYKFMFPPHQHEGFMQMSDLTVNWLQKLGSAAIFDMTMGDRCGPVL